MAKEITVRVCIMEETSNNIVVKPGVTIPKTYINNMDVWGFGVWKRLQGESKDGMVAIVVPSWVAVQRGLL